MVHKYKYGVSKVIMHPQGTYRVAYNTKKKSLGNSTLLWFKSKKQGYLNDEDPVHTRRMLNKLRIK